MRGISKLPVYRKKFTVKILKISFISFFLINTYCQKNVTPEEYIKLANERTGPFCIVKEFETFDFELYYRPTEYFMAQSIINKNGMYPVSVLNTYDKGYYFVLKIVSKDSTNIERKLLSYKDKNKAQNELLLFNIKDYATLGNGEIEIKCSQSMVDRNWGMHTDISLLLAFTKTDETGKEIDFNKSRLTLRDFGLITGTVIFPLDKFDKKLKVSNI